jgi:hypothetical protein
VLEGFGARLGVELIGFGTGALLEAPPHDLSVAGCGCSCCSGASRPAAGGSVVAVEGMAVGREAGWWLWCLGG